MKAIMLDVDGVINTFDPKNMATGDHFSPAACKNLNKLLNHFPDSFIVVSSSWRIWGLDFMKKVLKTNGIDPSRVIDITGDEPGERGDQIRAWLSRHPEVDSFVILDDESDFTGLMDKLVQTNSYVGLTEDDVKKAIKILEDKV